MSFITAFRERVFIASGDLIRTFRISEETELKNFISWSKINPERIQKPSFDIEKELKAVEKRVILCLAHSNVLTTHGRRLVAVGTNEKQIHVFEYFVNDKGDIVTAEHIVTSVVPKAPTAIVFDKEDAYVVVGDRAGDVHRFSVLNGSAIEMAGAISMILDVAFSPDGKRLLMADRDEKVRALRYPATSVIDSFFLGHTEYVKTLAVQDNDSLWSSGGDKNLYNWSIAKCSAPRRTLDLSQFDAPIRKISINLQHKKIAVIFEKIETVVIVDLNQESLQTTSVSIVGESQCLDIASTKDYFAVLGRSTVHLIDLNNMEQKFVPIDEELTITLTSTNDAIDNLFKNVTHNNQQEYEKRKADKFEQIEKKKRRLNEDINGDDGEGPGPSNS
ncbi:tRNA (guanine-N(7)-)-methyltransferase non-catalytic subunit [Caenorhabditis elegans]|uniref:tRNA (guanine-N(7)-)-methyltransferase non-catalytic subunit n=1 Tax=Caenorhabditis elegans TaxID=6239 RepID=WDR4_CAEEL|nr:tRNA (guanine-N(7)-)-methyltransferase non-catalytic subunit [Caenorhabditis elegans]Q23232.1 RecName: Full=tRNA (guanine-N(7)-)-methyltransferase non-catalytic subunit; AltName: Full=WD repeat-containing protein 4 homolog [Caenorhabditis elegans]CCD70714.1 tRNA (guanine-N(7)-)-methyltransferase non-catalytic subunit [Caenorhabditis elegans]|eukprot:NP_498476.1 tRNA (guanine-N(7)-)-methyltransferase non-catalytic subunit [Caenorhabditis elegans]